MVAKIFEPVVSRWRDTHGGIVGARLFDQDGCRVHASGRQPRLTATQALRVGNAGMVSEWRALAPAQRAAWDQFGVDWPGTDKYGYSISWSGWNWFVRYNSRLQLAGLSTNSTPPGDPSASYTPGFAAWFDAPTSNFLLSFAPAPALGEWLRIQRRLQASLSTASVPLPMNFYRFIQGPAISPVIIAHIPGPYDPPALHWVRVHGGDSAGRVDSWWADSVQTG